MATNYWYSSGHKKDYTRAYRDKRSKTDWAGIGIGDAFKNNLEYHVRIAAQRIFYSLTKKAQNDVARIAGAGSENELKAIILPQLSPCYSTYPAMPAAYAAIGLTAFLELKARANSKVLHVHLKSYLDNPAAADGVSADPSAYKVVAGITTNWIQTRLQLEDLSRVKSLASVEMYRLFSASQEDLRFASLSEILRAVILYGDIIPEWEKLVLHPFTKILMNKLTKKSAPFFEKLPSTKSMDLISLGVLWVREICFALSRYLPPPEDEEAKEKNFDLAENDNQQQGFAKRQNKFDKLKEQPPLDQPRAPLLHDTQDPVSNIFGSVVSITNASAQQNSDKAEQSEPSEVVNILQNFAKVLDDAGGQKTTWEDMRSDILQSNIKNFPFNDGPIKGNPAEGHEVSIEMGNNIRASGEIHDKAIELSDNHQSVELLLEESKPITDSLKRSLYPNIEQIPVIQKLRTSGSLDPARLPVADFIPTIFKRYRIVEKADQRGRPMLVIACDGSASLNSQQMKMLKNLTAGWLVSTVKSSIQILAGLYTSGQIRHGVSGPLVQWIYHPQKTPATGRLDAVRALVSMPDSGTGGQSDALSIAFIMEEARRLARGSMIYLVLITDTAWNQSFRTKKTGKEEVYGYFENAYSVSAGKLHTTLVALGVSNQTGFECLLDAVITVSNEELNDPGLVANKIGTYVAGCIKVRQKLMATR